MGQIDITKEFYDSGEDDLLKKRFNAATDSYFKAIVTLCDYQLQKNQGIIPKNHNERFDFLKTNYPIVYSVVSDLFSKHRKTYNQQAEENLLSLGQFF